MRYAFPSVCWLVLYCVLASCGQRIDRSVVRDRNGRMRALLDRVDGLKHGSVILYAADSRVRCTGWNLRGQPVFWWHRYHPNGAIASLEHFTAGVKDGVQCYWSPEGQLLCAEKFTRGLSDGPLIKFYADGTPEQWSTFVNGKQHGRHLHWFREGNKPTSFLEGEFMHGSHHGHWIEVLTNGQILWQGNYDNGRLLNNY